MKFRIQFTSTTMNQLRTIWKQAFDRGDLRLVRRTSALLSYGQGQEIDVIAADVSVSPETVYAWLRAFLVDRFDSLGYRARPGRKEKLTQTQKRRLRKLIEEGPLAGVMNLSSNGSFPPIEYCSEELSDFVTYLYIP